MCFKYLMITPYFITKYSKYPAAAAAKSLQLYPTLCDPIGGSPPGSSVHGILQARTLEWVAIIFSWGSSQPRDQTRVSRVAGRLFTIEPPQWLIYYLLLRASVRTARGLSAAGHQCSNCFILWPS